MKWILSIHVVFVVCWFAGLFYLPRLFVYHAMSNDTISQERFKIMERKLFWGIMTPSAVITVLTGLWLSYEVWHQYESVLWPKFKFALVLLLIGYHLLCARYLYQFKNDRNLHSHVFYRWFNEVPVVLLFGIIIFVIVKPF